MTHLYMCVLTAEPCTASAAGQRRRPRSGWPTEGCQVSLCGSQDKQVTCSHQHRHCWVCLHWRQHTQECHRQHVALLPGLCCRPGSSPGASQQHGLQHSSASGAPSLSSTILHFTGGDGVAHSSSRSGPASPVARVLSGMAASIQRGISGAGGAVVRTLSGAGLLPLSQHGSASYERIVDEAGTALPVPLQECSTDGRSGRSRLGGDQPHLQLQHSAPQPSRFFLAPGSSAASADRLLPGTPEGQQAAGRVRPVPGAASLQGVGARDASPASERGMQLPRPAGLARIRTRLTDLSGSGLLQAGRLGMEAGEPLQLAAGNSAEGGSSRPWRTRQEYQADLAAGSSPISVSWLEQQTPSEPGQRMQRVRGHAGLNFVQTPTSTDATNR